MHCKVLMRKVSVLHRINRSLLAILSWWLRWHIIVCSDVSEWVSEWVGEWVSEWVGKWVSEWVGE